MLIPNNLRSARVLLVDDEPQQLDLRAHVLRVSGFSVLTSAGADEAMSIIGAGAEKIDVAVLDYQMPITNGCLLADRLRSCRPEVRIILHSGAVDIPRSEMTSVDVFIPKNDGVAALLKGVTELAAAAIAGPGLSRRNTHMCFDQGLTPRDPPLFKFDGGISGLIPKDDCASGRLKGNL